MYFLSPVRWYIMTIMRNASLVALSLNEMPCTTPVRRVPCPLNLHWSPQPPPGRCNESSTSAARRADSKYFLSPLTL